MQTNIDAENVRNEAIQLFYEATGNVAAIIDWETDQEIRKCKNKLIKEEFVVESIALAEQAIERCLSHCDAITEASNQSESVENIRVELVSIKEKLTSIKQGRH